MRRIAHARYGRRNTSFGPRDSCAPSVQRNHVRYGMKGVDTQLMVVTGVVIAGKGRCPGSFSFHQFPDGGFERHSSTQSGSTRSSGPTYLSGGSKFVRTQPTFREFWAKVRDLIPNFQGSSSLQLFTTTLLFVGVICPRRVLRSRSMGRQLLCLCSRLPLGAPYLASTAAVFDPLFA